METPLTKKQKYKELALSLKSNTAPNGENTVTKVPENWIWTKELVFFKQSLQWAIFSHIIQGLQEYYVLS